MTKIIARWQYLNGKIEQQECATADIARSVLATLGKDLTIQRGWAYYDDKRGTIDCFERETA